MIIDSHCHAGLGDAMTAPWNTTAPLHNYLRRAGAAGISKTIVFPAFHSDYAEANRALARLVKDNSDRLIGYAFVHTSRDTGRIGEMVETAVRRYGFRGIKIHGVDGMPNREVCEAAKRFALPILVDVVGRVASVDMFAPQYREVSFIIPHLGSFAGDWKAHQQVIDQLVRHPNVYADTSSVRHFDYIVEAIRRAGARKLIFGSDGPWLHPGVELQKIRLLGLPKQQESLILSGNILRLLGRGSRKRPLTAASAHA